MQTKLLPITLRAAPLLLLPTHHHLRVADAADGAIASTATRAIMVWSRRLQLQPVFRQTAAVAMTAPKAMAARRTILRGQSLSHMDVAAAKAAKGSR